MKTEDQHPWTAGFIRLPPDEMDLDEAMKNPLFVDFDQVDATDPMVGGMINITARQFAESGNPVLAFEAFFHSIERGVYPPLNVMRWMAEVLHRYHSDQGKKSLDEYFGTDRGRGERSTAYEKLLIEERNSKCLMEMDALMYLGATREEAASMVSRKMESTEWNKTSYDMKNLKDGTLATLHSRRREPRLDAETAEIFGLNDPERVRFFLKQFPKDSLAPSLRTRLK